MSVRSHARRRSPKVVAQSFDTGAELIVETRPNVTDPMPPGGSRPGDEQVDGYEVPRSGWPAGQAVTEAGSPPAPPEPEPAHIADPPPDETVSVDGDGPGSPAVDGAELVSDIQSILGGGSPSTDPLPPAPSSGPAPTGAAPLAVQKASSRTRIFDELAASMSHAKSYDLGSVALEHRFDEFDRAEDERKASRPVVGTSPVVDREPPPPSPAGAAGTGPAPATEFVEDLDLIRGDAQTEDIPLDPGVGGRSIGESALEAGDVILSTTDHPVSETIRKVTGDEVSHAALYVGNGNVIEAIESGVILRGLDTAVEDDTLAVAYRHRDMTPVKASQVIAFAEDHARRKTPFDTWGLIQVAPGQLVRAICNQKEGAEREACLANAANLRVGTNDDGAFFCSELVLAGFEHAGLSITETDPSWSSPGQIVELHHNGLFDYVGHLKA